MLPYGPLNLAGVQDTAGRLQHQSLDVVRGLTLLEIGCVGRHPRMMIRDSGE
jgi:hypothetical protein